MAAYGVCSLYSGICVRGQRDQSQRLARESGLSARERQCPSPRTLTASAQSPVNSRGAHTSPAPLHSQQTLSMSHQEHENLEPYMEDCSDTDDEYSAYQYHNNNNNIPSNNNNNNTEFEDKNNNNRSGTSGAGQHARTQPQPHQGSVPSFHHKLHDRPLNITVTAKVLFGSVSAISALNAERKKKPS